MSPDRFKEVIKQSMKLTLEQTFNYGITMAVAELAAAGVPLTPEQYAITEKVRLDSGEEISG